MLDFILIPGFFFFFNIYFLTYLFIKLCQVFVAALGIFDLHFGMGDLQLKSCCLQTFQLQHVGLSSTIRGRTQAHPLHWECGILATGPSEKSCSSLFNIILCRNKKNYKRLLILTIFFLINVYFILGFPGGSDSKESTCNVGDLGSIPGSGRYPGEGNGNPLQYSCLRNPMDREAWQATVHGVAKNQT